MKPRSRSERVAHARSCARMIDSVLAGRVRAGYARDVLAQSISPNLESGQSVYAMAARQAIKGAVDALTWAARGEVTISEIVGSLVVARRAYMAVRK